MQEMAALLQRNCLWEFSSPY